MRNRLQQQVADRMPEGVVDVLEAIQVQKQHGAPLAVATGQRNRAGDPVAEQHAVRQVGQKIVLGEVSHFLRDRARCADIVENNHGARDFSAAVMDRGGGIFDGGFGPVAPYQYAVRRQAHGLVFPHGLGHRIGRGLAGGAVDDAEYFD